MNKNNISKRNDSLFFYLIVFVCAIVTASCSTSSDDVIGEPSTDPEKPSQPVKISPTLEWGKNVSEIVSLQNKTLRLNIKTDTLLRFSDSYGAITLDYVFKNNVLIGASMTQANIKNVTDVVGTWLKGYSQIAASDDVVLYATTDKSTLAYGKTISGTNYNYASVAWSYIDPDVNGDSYDFTPSGTINGYDYVDLGTGIGWATSNVGAKNPSDNGNYYMWAETKTHSTYNWPDYSLYTGSTSGYLDTDAFRTPYSNISKTFYDVAHVKMGDKWRMPTRAELSSLISNCEIEAYTYDNTDGVVITGPSGKSIFMPGAGEAYRDEIRYSGSVYLWSSITYGKSSAYYVFINKGGWAEINSNFKFYGFSVRGVVDM